ncbi:branched-chain amino acid ABC transporter permease [Hoeflea sp. WL0058]|uniref:Branched-chain amino acid ABC transporter permease n=1 Tax=Flavimaribacter sediminis TaxID=2865987 RepID=A0AAE2ZQT0_9HYPH|nr:branched-chain amino acid ABC transporter permease [Flavimaribacter sediminis]MBW8639042.1 branched-chain amino acid ABC transporter permease [Flavimaribacter sediminis]
MALLDTLLLALKTTFVSGLVLASLYVLMASGLALVWNTLGIFNFTHGAIMAAAAYVAWQISDPKGYGLGLAAGIVGALIASGVMGLVINRLLIAPFLNQKNVVLIAVMTTLSGAFFIENSALLIWGPRIKQLEKVVDGNLRVAGTVISGHEVVIIVIAPLLMLGLWAFLKFTWTGRAIRAVAQNREFAELSGIDVRRMYAVAFATAAMLAGFAGIMLGAIRFITPGLGAEPLLKALIVVILGGLGSIPGTILGAYVVGFSEALSTYYIGAYWTQAVLFLIFIAILLIRPSGLLGKD